MDGDSTRRIAFNTITLHKSLIDSSIGKIVHKFPLVNTKVGKDNETTPFDPTHLTKQSWTCLTSGKIMLDNILMSKKDLAPTIVQSTEALTYHKDKQNVPSAVNCLLPSPPLVKQLLLLADVYFAGSVSLLMAKEKEIDVNMFDLIISLKKPHGRNVGVYDLEFDWTLLEEEAAKVTSGDDHEVVLCELVTKEGLEPTVDADGKFVYKATMLKDIMSKFSLQRSTEAHPELDTKPSSAPRELMDDMIFVGVLINENNIFKIFNGQVRLVIGTIGITKMTTKFNVKILNLKEVEEKLY